MASQNTDMVEEVDEAKLAPLQNGEPATGDPSESSPDAKEDSSEEVLESHQDAAMSPGPAVSPDSAGSPDPAATPDPSSIPDPAPSPDTATMPDLAVSQDPGPRENPTPQNPNGSPANVEGNSPLLGLPFPRKLWMIVEDDTFTSVSWNDAGDTVVIREDLFQTEVLSQRGARQIFETDSLKSFIRLLNVHGFSKIRPRGPSAYRSGKSRITVK